MVKASAYTLEELLEKLKDAFGEFIDENYDAYKEIVEQVKGRLEEMVKKYEDDAELREYYENFMEYYESIGKSERELEKEKLAWIKSELNHIVHWRKLGMSAGRVLPFKDYRSLRGGIGGR